MGPGGLRIFVLLAVVAVPAAAQESAPVSVSAGAAVLLAPVQGSSSLRSQDGGRVTAAVWRALEARGCRVLVSPELLGQAVVACQTPECVEQALAAAEAGSAIVPAIWSRESGGEEVTLTLMQKAGGGLNATGVVEEDLFGVIDGLVGELLARRVGTASETAAASEAAAASGTGVARGAAGGRGNVWKAGPIVLVAAGAAAIVAIGVGAAVANDDQQLNTSAAAAWGVIGAAAIAGGIAWWVVGERRRRAKSKSAGALAPEIAFHPSKIDLRLRF